MNSWFYFNYHHQKMLDNKLILGSEEWCSFPELGIPTIKARVDSGAKTSALHAINISPFVKDGEHWVKFDINPIQNNVKTIISCQAPLIDKRIVKSSSGFREQRFVIQTQLQLGESSWAIEMTLTNRDSMGFRMLLGREAMSGRALVDPEQKYLLGDTSTDKLKDLYPEVLNEKRGLKIGLLASNRNCTATKELWKPVNAVVTKCNFSTLKNVT